MIISRTHRKIVLKLKNPSRVTTVLPSAKEFDYKGVRLVAVPHRIEETRVLRNLGFAVPSPIRTSYHWPTMGNRTPMKAQIATADFLTTNPKAFCLNDMGTGKTLASIWAWDFLRRERLAGKLLVVAPLSTLERTWVDELFNALPGVRVAVLHGTADRRRKLLADKRFDAFIINHDGIKVLRDELVANRDIDSVVIDELATFRNAGTGRWKALHAVIAGRRNIWGLTGTPTPNEPPDAWAQCRLIAPERVPKFYGKFRDMTMRQLGPFKWIARPAANDIVKDAMQPAIRFARSECIDLPPCVFLPRTAQLTNQQQIAYKDMMTSMAVEAQSRQIVAVNEGVKLSKLVQIACGVVYDNQGERVQFPAVPRLKVVEEVIEQAGGKVIVFVPFTSALDWLTAELSKRYTVAKVDGSTSKGARDKAFREFQYEAMPRVLAAQPAAMSHGLTLTAANTIVWYAPITSNETYQQANARITRPGQTLNQFIVNIAATRVEHQLYQRLQERQSMQGLLLDLLAEAA